ncbi:cation-translocating P-type ATPase [uncultured Arthrobacter sp.]|uniref:heavy metal translocating P-type ATPase n=1 Tax=uncultured Arthrobacter sp. TaxID=114050 RepID=UPI003217EB3A
MNQTNLELRVANMDCEHDAASLERALRGWPGMVDLTVYPKSAKVKLVYDADTVTLEALRHKLVESGFPPQEGREASGPPMPWQNPKVITSVAAGILLLVGWLLSLAGAPELISTLLYVAAILSGGYYFGREAIEELIFERQIGIELLMLVAAVVAALMGEVAEGAMLAFLYSLSEAAEGYTEERTRSAIKALMDLAPKTALVRRSNQELEIPVEEVQVGDIFLVRPGQAIATDGEVIDGRSSVNQAPVTGESVPVEKEPGDSVFAGSINGEGALDIRATKTFAENTISRIIAMVEEAQERKGASQRFIERFGARYSPAVLAIGILIALLPPLFFGGEWVDWIARATVFIVAAAPCALVISIPITLVATLGTGARNGVLIKGGVFIEELGRVKVVAMDKTGTLTRGTPEVTDVIALDKGSILENDVLALAAGIEQRSQHPLAQAVVRRAQAARDEPRRSQRQRPGPRCPAGRRGRGQFPRFPGRVHPPLRGAGRRLH